jgi:formylglycine-generating enzyme required for sulfatase activity
MYQFIETLPNQVALEMIILPTGNFLMGTLSLDHNYPRDEKPSHKVNLNSFAIGKYPVTQSQYQAVMGNNPSHFSYNPQNPVEQVSWNDAQAFCKKLSQIIGKTYRLPTEAEWEYACRAGTTTRFYYGNDANELGDYAWYFRNSQQRTHPVGQKKPNNWGLYDMIGNVWEWCADTWHDSYDGAPTDGSAWIEISNKSYKDIVVRRGGSWVNDAINCYCGYRSFSPHRVSDFNYGFRVVCDN